MSTKRCWAILLWAACVWPQAAWAAETVDSIEKAVLERWNEVRSMQAQYDVAATLPLNGTTPAPFYGTGVFEYLKSGERPRSRAELAVNLTETLRLGQVTALYDGANAYVITDLLGQVSTRRHDAAGEVGNVTSGGQALFAALRKYFNLTALPGEKVNNDDAYVIEGVLKPGNEDSLVSRLRLHIGKQTGMVVKADGYDRQNARIVSATATRVVVNGPVAESRFVYAPPVAATP